MTPPIATRSVQESAHSWPQEWGSDHDQEKHSRDRSSKDHEQREDIWEELAKINQVHGEKRAEQVIEYLETRLSQLESADTISEEEDSDVQQDPFSSHHSKVVNKGAGEYE
jgi:hypothetical protein